MARRPVDQMAASGKPEGRDALWPVIRSRVGQWVSVRDFIEATDMNRRTISSYLGCLVAGKIVERRNQDGRPPEYRLNVDPGREAPRLRRDGTRVEQGSGTENMWRSMRMFAEFSPRDLAAHSATDLTSVTEATAKSYCSLLRRAGYLRVIRKAVPNKSQAIYRLVRNSGPKPPQIQRIKQVFDPNTETVYSVGDRS